MLLFGRELSAKDRDRGPSKEHAVPVSDPDAEPASSGRELGGQKLVLSETLSPERAQAAVGRSRHRVLVDAGLCSATAGTGE